MIQRLVYRASEWKNLVSKIKFGLDMPMMFFNNTAATKRIFTKASLTIKKLRDKRVPRVSLLKPEDSAWWKMYESRIDQSFVTLTGFDWLSFHAPVPEFETNYTCSLQMKEEQFIFKIIIIK